MAWRRTGDTSLPEPMLTQLTDAYKQHQREMSWYNNVKSTLVQVMACCLTARWHNWSSVHLRIASTPNQFLGFMKLKCIPDSNVGWLDVYHDDVIKWKHFPRYWPFVRGIHRSPVNSPHKGQWRGALMFTLICARINGWVNNREAGDLRRNPAHYDVIVMYWHPKVALTLGQVTLL